MDRNVYFGPYIVTTVKLEQVAVDRCKDHNRPADAEFCPKCGTSKAHRVKTNSIGRPLSWETNYDREGCPFWDYFYCVNSECKDDYLVEVWLPFNDSGHVDFGEVLDIASVDVAADKQKMKTQFEPEIAYLALLSNSLEFKFGVVTYYS